MAKIIERVTKKFPQEPLDKNLLLTSIRDFKPEGVKLGVEKVSKPFLTKYGKVQFTVVLCVMEEMEKCRMYALDDEGQFIMEKDELTGEENKKIKIDSCELELAKFFFSVTCDEKDVDEDTEFKVYPSSGAYPLFHTALVEAGELPENSGGKSFISNGKELKEALEGFEFTGKYARKKGKYNFDYLLVEVE